MLTLRQLSATDTLREARKHIEELEENLEKICYEMELK